MSLDCGRVPRKKPQGKHANSVVCVVSFMAHNTYGEYEWDFYFLITTVALYSSVQKCFLNCYIYFGC